MEKNKNSGNTKYGIERINLAKYLRDEILILIENKYFIENGTLLGAWRNNKLIDHDDDFDFAVLIDSTNEISEIFSLIRDNLNTKYKCRIIESYSNKIEIYDPLFGKYILDGKNYNNADFHNVTVDLQFYLKDDNCYKCLYYRHPKELIKKDILLPLKQIVLEKEIFNCPNNTKKIFRNKLWLFRQRC